MSTHKANKEKRDFFLANVIYIPYLYHSFLWLATSCRSCSWFTPWMPFTSRDLISQQFFAQSRVQSGYLSWVGFGGCSTNRYDVGCGVFIQSKLCVIRQGSFWPRDVFYAVHGIRSCPEKYFMHKISLLFWALQILLSQILHLLQNLTVWLSLICH